MLCFLWDFSNSKLKIEQYKQKTSAESYNTNIKILANWFERASLEAYGSFAWIGVKFEVALKGNS